MEKVKIFYPGELYDSAYRGHLFPLLKPFLKNKGYTDEERLNHYGLSSRDITFVDEPLSADVLILPMSWNYYLDNAKKELALNFIDRYSQFGKKIFIYNAGDKSYKIPSFPNVFVFRLSRSRMSKRRNNLVIPPFIKDPQKTFYNSDPISLRSYVKKPVVGFCGFAKTSKTDAGKELLKIELQNLKSRLGLRKEEPQQLLSSSYFRGRILSKLKNSPYVESNFIIRKDYRAGIIHNSSHPTVTEFYSNIKNSDYVFCARGSGNFSVRFYETFAMGRIPVYVNTEGGLPLENQIQWKDHVVWVEKKEENCIGEKIYDFHHKMNSRSFKELLINNRKLWENYLTFGAYFKHILASEILGNGNEK